MNASKGSYKVVVGDATNPTLAPDELAIIPHITNNVGYGSGFVKAIEDRWPGIMTKKYCNWLNSARSSTHLNYIRKLGDVQFYKPKRGGQIMLANMVAQDNAGSMTLSGNFPPIRYTALVECMKKVQRKVASLYVYHTIKHIANTGNLNIPTPPLNITIHCPFFGSGIAGAPWAVIEQLIHELWVRRSIDVTAYEFKAPPNNVFSLADDEALKLFNKMTSRLHGQQLRIKLPDISHANNP